MTNPELSGFSDLLLKLYRLSHELPIDAFQDAALALSKPVLPFNSSMWGTATVKPAGVDIHTVHLHRMSPEMLAEYEALKHQDATVSMVLSQGRSTIDIHIDSFYSSHEQRDYREFSQRFGVENMLVAADNNPRTNFAHWISFYRSDKAARYTQSDRQWVDQLAPHLMQALAMNRVMHLDRLAPLHPGRLRRGVAIADLHGVLYHATPHFEALLRTEWPSGQTHALPTALLQAFLSGEQRFLGRTLVVQRHVEHRLLFLKARARCKADSLTPRENAVAQLVAEGRTHKQIAQQLSRAPATVRNQIQAVYAKLGVSNIAGLIEAMRLAD